MDHYYANATQMYGGPYDLTLDFGRKVGAEGEVEFGVRIAMSWEHATTMVEALKKLIASYENELGPLPDVASKIVSEIPEEEDK